MTKTSKLNVARRAMHHARSNTNQMRKELNELTAQNKKLETELGQLKKIIDQTDATKGSKA